ncbi:MAG: hypothetical protein WCT37_03295 [Patescibacteria group bacterium]|jgi:hypothetical protein
MVLAKLNIWESGLRRQLKLVWLQDKIILVLFFVSLFLNLGFYLAIYFSIRPTEASLVLHYSVYFGIDLIGPWFQLYLTPLVGSFLGLINLALALIFYQKEKIAAYLLAVTTLLLEIFLLIGGGLLILVNS